MSKNECAIDLLWVRPKQVGGIEYVIRNLIDGFLLLDLDYSLWLLVSKDNAYSFEKYLSDTRIHMKVCNILSADVSKRILWQNMNLGKEIKKLGLKKCFEPYYCKPIFGVRKIDFYTIIHDLQAIHYPQYFSTGKVIWMRISWKSAIKTSKKVIAISNYVKKDIIEHFKVLPSKIVTIYNPVTIDYKDCCELNSIEKKYGIKEKEYFFTVSSLLPHKNLKVLLEVMRTIKENKTNLPQKLIISGIGGKSRSEITEVIKNYNLENNVLLTPFIENNERNALYKYCKAFLFPSIFEGFGMPPIEAMILGAPVVTTRETCIEEVTQGKANYVTNPLDVDEWIDTIENCKVNNFDKNVYDIKEIAKKYYEILFYN